MPVSHSVIPARPVRYGCRRGRPFLIAAAICFIFGLLGWGTYYARAAHVIRHGTKRMQKRVLVLKRIESQLNEMRRRTTTLDGLATPLVAAINDRSFWVQVIEELNARLPKEDIWITELVATSRGVPLDASGAGMLRAEPSPFATVSPRAASGPAELAVDGLLLRGLYLFNSKQQEVVVDYFRNLAASPWFAIDQNNQANVIKPTTPNNTEWAYPYELRLDLRKPVKLP